MRSSTHSALIVGSFCLLVAACSPAPETARHTVPEYQADKELRERQMAACARDPGTLGKTPDCVNAKQAQATNDIGSARDLPPVGLSSGKDGAQSPDSSSDRAPPK